MAIVMALIVFTGFTFHLAMGRSTFAKPLIVHAHAVVFMGWIVIYLLQNLFVATGNKALHRRLGWLGAGWIVAMIILGTAVTVRMVRLGEAPFFFTPLNFLVFDPLTVTFFAGLTAAAIALRRQTDWHRRLHYCGMALLLGPAISRMLPSPLLMPYAFEAAFVPLLVFPAIGAVADIRRTGRVHPAWWYGMAAMVAMLLVTEAVTHSPAGIALYDAVTAGSPGAEVPPLAFGAPPRP
ncbi:MAG: hypothetical protein J7495_11820 [Sphingomonas sp.]|nr:hypothetical protein [Sphingomonas sp.]